MTKIEGDDIEQISSMLEDGLVCDISMFKLTLDRNFKRYNREQYFYDKANRYLSCYDLKIYECYRKWSEILTRVGKDDDVYVYEDRNYFFMYRGICVKVNSFNILNNIGLPPFEYELPKRVSSKSEGWMIQEVKEITFQEKLTSDFLSRIEQFINSKETETY